MARTRSLAVKNAMHQQGGPKCDVKPVTINTLLVTGQESILCEDFPPKSMIPLSSRGEGSPPLEGGG
jgi:hypothetical protein